MPQTFDDVCAASNFNIKEIGRCFNMIKDALKITVDIITTTNFIPRFCGNLSKYYRNVTMRKRKKKFNT